MELLRLPLKSEIFYNLIKIDDKEKTKENVNENIKEKEGNLYYILIN
jgi:hypothetical protein